MRTAGAFFQKGGCDITVTESLLCATHFHRSICGPRHLMGQALLSPSREGEMRELGNGVCVCVQKSEPMIFYFSGVGITDLLEIGLKV